MTPKGKVQERALTPTQGSRKATSTGPRAKRVLAGVVHLDAGRPGSVPHGVHGRLAPSDNLVEGLGLPR